MKILTTGKGTSGSWQVRGVQLGGAVGKAIPKASLEECQKADIIVVVKRIGDFISSVKDSGKPWIWDLVDFYPQPECTNWSREYAIKWARKEIEREQPNGVIYANQKMADDIGLPGVVIYHHARPDIVINPIRERVKCVGYEGSEKYLGSWRNALEEECRKRGWQFRVDLPLHDLDIVVAFRDKPFAGYTQVSWKSNVKLANAHGTGTPFVGNSESGYDETLTGYERFIFHPKQLAWAFDELEPYETRKMISERFIENAITLESSAQRLREYARYILGLR